MLYHFGLVRMHEDLDLHVNTMINGEEEYVRASMEVETRTCIMGNGGEGQVERLMSAVERKKEAYEMLMFSIEMGDWEERAERERKDLEGKEEKARETKREYEMLERGDTLVSFMF